MHVSKTRLPVPLTVALTCRCPVDALTEAGWRTIAQVMPMGYPYYARHVLRYIEKYIYVYLTEKNIYIYVYLTRVAIQVAHVAYAGPLDGGAPLPNIARTSFIFVLPSEFIPRSYGFVHRVHLFSSLKPLFPGRCIRSSPKSRNASNKKRCIPTVRFCNIIVDSLFEGAARRGSYPTSSAQ